MSPTPQSAYLLSVVTFVYLGAFLFYLAALIFGGRRLGRAASLLTYLAVGLHLGAFIWRWAESHALGAPHAPLSNLYESLVFFALVVGVIYLLIELTTKSRALGVFALPLALLALAYAGLQPKQILPLVPALKSNWLIVHVVTAFLAYGAFALAAGLGLAVLPPRAGAWRAFSRRLPGEHTLTNLIYQNMGFGFVLLSVGIATGAVWAEQAWGSYWSWDPKETWSLITWLTYAFILHLRALRGWSGRRLALAALAGFAVVLFTYFGVNLLLPGLHSYA